MHTSCLSALSHWTVEGMLSSSVPDLVSTLKKRALDIVIGSRYVQGGKTGRMGRRRQIPQPLCN